MSTIRVRNLRKRYWSTEALRGISFDINQGEVVGFLGPNGAGKTTTMKILTCFMAATSGDAHVSSYDCSKESITVRQKIGYLPENNPLYADMTAFEYLRYVAELHDVSSSIILERIKDVAVDCGLSDKIHQPIGTLSKGYRQRVGLAAALVHDPEILILDEPTVGLDPNQIVEMRNLIKKLGKEKTVILCSHILAEVEATCNRIIIISEGKIVASGTPAELRGNVEGHANIRLIIRGDRQEVIKMLKKISGVRKVDSYTAKEKGAYGYDLITTKKRDLREAVTQAVFENEFKLLEIQKEVVTLEEIFNEVTKGMKTI
ncbi:ATP-binding cassette domain-containing protein [Candidatus Pacearchaeota archaeon]|nr:ATP-binding cassette domain-containing protein [Candidatus Pacearchaeota archaeon]